MVLNAVLITVLLDTAPENLNEGIEAIRILFLVIFTLELALKLFAFSIPIYFSDYGNCFDGTGPTPRGTVSLGF